MTTLYFDVETTGFQRAAGTPLDRCPYIVQLAAVLMDDAHGQVATMNVIIQPDGWTVPENVAAIHGITTEKATTFGIPARVAMATLSQLCRRADLLVAHNIAFDLKMVGYELERAKAANMFEGKPKCCTMAAARDHCKLPGQSPGKYKNPKLQEAHTSLLGIGFVGAHDAMADVLACLRVHRYLTLRRLI